MHYFTIVIGGSLIFFSFHLRNAILIVKSLHLFYLRAEGL